MMNKIIAYLVLMTFLALQAIAQDNIKKVDLDKTKKLISDSLPRDWIINSDINNKNEFVIQSPIIELNGAMDSNDPLTIKEHCEINILIVPRVSPDSIYILRKRNRELKDNLPPQNSKDNLQKWYEENEKTLIILDSEPTNYDNKYSYRIKCRRLPIKNKDMDDYNKVTKYLNQLFKQY